MKPKFLLLFFMNLFLASCVVVNRYNPISDKVLFKENRRKSNTILVRVKRKYYENGNLKDIDPRQERKLKKKIVKFLEESNLFKDVKSSLDIADIQLRIEMEEKVELDESLFTLSYITFFIFPGFISGNHATSFQFRDNKNQLIKEYKRQVMQNIYVQLFLLPVLPIYFFGSDPYEVITKSVLFEANRDGIFR